MDIDTKTGKVIPDTVAGFAGNAQDRLANKQAYQEKIGVPSPVSSAQPQSTASSPSSYQQPTANSPTGKPYTVWGKPTKYTGAVTPEGATNPYTGGVETASPAGTLYGVNQGPYSPENKQAQWTKAGGVGTYNPEAFYRNEQTGAQEIKPGYINAAPAAPGAPVTPTTQSQATGAAQAGSFALPGEVKPVTGDVKTDTELAKLKEEEMKKRKEATDSYALYQGELEKNKGYYTNFDEVNSRYNNVMNDIRSTLESTGQTVLTDEQAQAIAGKYGLGLSDVKQPLNVFNALNTTDEGKRVLGETKFNQGLADMRTNFERNKQALENTLKQTELNVGNQIQDVSQQMQRNVDFMKASGAWSGATRSSAYQAGLDNVVADSMKTIQRLGQTMANTKETNAQNVANITDDFNRDTTRAKAEFDAQMKDIKHNQGIMLAGLQDKYGTGNKTLTQALDAITEEFAGKSIDVYTKYVNAQKAAVDVANSKIEQVSKLDSIIDNLTNKRYNEYVANNGALLSNASMTNILAEVKNGTMTTAKAEDLKNIMTTSVTNTLSQFGSVSAQDVHTIETMLDAGKTPTQIVAQMKSLPNYSQKVIKQVYDLGNGVKRVQYADGTTEDVESATGKTVTVPYGSSLYDTRTGKWVTNDGTQSTGGTAGTSGAGIDLRDAVSKYPNEASLKNNNPAGITYNDAFAKRLQDAGIQFTKGTSRPSAEGGSYFGFPNIQEGLKAYQLLWSSPSYQNLTVGQALARWGTDSVPGVDNSKKVSELTPQEFSQLQIAQMRKESPGMLKELTARGYVTENGIEIPQAAATSAGFDQNKTSQYDLYNSKGTLPTGMKAGMPHTEQFIREAGAYKQAQAAQAAGAGAKQYTDDQIGVMASIEKLDSAGLKVLQDAGLDSTDYGKFAQGMLPPTKKQVNQAESIIDSIDELENHDGFSDAVGFKGLQTGYTVPGSDKADFEALFKNLRDTLVLPNLGQLKGAMSDKDVEFLRNTATALSQDMSEDQFRSSLGKLRQKYAEIVAKSGGQSKVSTNQSTGNAATWAGTVTTPSGIKFKITK